MDDDEDDFTVSVAGWQPGQARLLEPPLSDTFVVCLESATPPGPAECRVQLAQGVYALAFSRVCTHLGGFLLSPRHCDQPLKLDDGHVIRCPCHFTAFDLLQTGRVLVGHATSCLPQRRLEPAKNSRIRVLDWYRPKRVPYGLPYPETDEEEAP